MLRGVDSYFISINYFICTTPVANAKRNFDKITVPGMGVTGHSTLAFKSYLIKYSILKQRWQRKKEGIRLKLTAVKATPMPEKLFNYEFFFFYYSFNLTSILDNIMPNKSHQDLV